MFALEKMLSQAKSWYGRKEEDGSHKEIIDVYNEAARRLGLYIMSYEAPWCAAYITACAWKCGLTDVIAPSASCESMINWYKARGLWKNPSGYTPKVGDIIFYDWGANGTYDHVGLITSVSGIVATAFEGNMSDSVGYRNILLSSKEILGYGTPKYEDSSQIGQPSPGTSQPQVPQNIIKQCNISLPMLRRGYGMGSLSAYKPWVKTLQELLIIRNFSCGGAGADGEFGPATDQAVKNYQTEKNLTADGIVGINTWNAILEG